jgi:hypothetical protein
MKKTQIEVGQLYVAKVSGKLAKVKIVGESVRGGWNAINLATKRDVRIRSAARLRHAFMPKEISPLTQLRGLADAARQLQREEIAFKQPPVTETIQ